MTIIPIDNQIKDGQGHTSAHSEDWRQMQRMSQLSVSLSALIIDKPPQQNLTYSVDHTE
jgi:hypothetical protein